MSELHPADTRRIMLTSVREQRKITKEGKGTGFSILIIHNFKEVKLTKYLNIFNDCRKTEK